MFLGMTLWFSATAATGAIAAEFRLTATSTAWLTMAVQGGFVLGTLFSAILNLPDVLNPRRLMAVGCVAGAVANAALVRTADPALIIAPAAFGAGGIATLMLASQVNALGGSATSIRILGVVSLALALLSVPFNFFALISWSMCF